ncbi:MAG: transposase [Chloroflexi bacterium]|nr:transposase [Chloroflexota bacterium]
MRPALNALPIIPRLCWKYIAIRPYIPARSYPARKRRPGRPMASYRKEYAQRWIVERTFAWLGNFRRLLMRHERLLRVYHGFMLLAFVLICLARIFE